MLATVLWEWPRPQGCPVRVQVERTVFDKLRRQVAASGSVETGGFLIGRAWADSSGYLVVVEDIRAVEDSRATRQEFTFPAEAVIQMHQELPAADVLPCDRTQLGWYHTHPGHGVFFSGPDVEMHHKHFARPYQVGLVIDPESEEARFFYWVAEQQMGPTQPHRLAGVFHPWTGRVLHQHPRHKVPERDASVLARRLGVGVAALGLSAGLATAAIALPPLVLRSTQDPADVRLAGFKAETQAYVMHLPKGRWRYKLVAPESANTAHVFTSTAEQELRVSEAQLRQSGISGPARVLLQRDGESAILAVDLPEWHDAFPQDENRGVWLKVPEGARAGDRPAPGRYYFRATDHPDRDRWIEYRPRQVR